MSLHVAITHNTSYKYDRNIEVSPQVIRLKPAPHTRTPVLSYSLKISPSDHFMNWQQDPFGNYMARVVFPKKIDHFKVSVELIVDMVTINPFDFFLEESAEKFPFVYEDQLKKELGPYLEIKEEGPLLYALFQRSKSYENDNSINFLVNLNSLVYKEVAYNIRLEPGIQSCETTLDIKTGSCRDSAWLLVQLLRMHGLASRFVSGYLIQLKPDQESVDGPSGTNKDFTDLHAWAEVYLPGAGWVGLDATSGLLAGEGHIPLSCTPDPGSAAPITGLTEVAKVEFHYENLIERIYETPRVTKPFTDKQWQDILDLGVLVDSILEREDVRLTMGGEPTFVSTENPDAEEWNTAADGVEKRHKGYDLTLRLKGHFAQNGLIHQGQGKWYPGEPIPRWQYIIYWRKDGLPLWSNPSHLADPRKAANASNEDAASLIKGITNQLGIPGEYVQTAFEDHYYFLWEKAKLPVDVDPKEVIEGKTREQNKLAALLQNGIENPVGYVLPIHYSVDRGRWLTCHWETNREKLYLIPGDSALGYRLPLKTLKSSEDDLNKVVLHPNPLDDLGALSHPGDVQERRGNGSGFHSTSLIKTALCVEVREGKVFVFLPPLSDLDQFVDLIHRIERACANMDQTVIIEGYTAPSDYRLEKLAITPDPGVLEVNVAPAHNWKEILVNYNTLFDEAKKCHLAAEKFMIDGRHTGTGGGNHITLGGRTPADSPLLRRPDLLRSMLNFWHNHPSMSYLFSSAFVGPTSQSPRVDEGRMHSILDLAIAFDELERHENPAPWIVDRLFRNILIDLTGNTHRAEFCIDKLYSPDSLSGRLGILELRGFDMPPSKEMCIIQILLVRALVARFWQQPFKRPLMDWGRDLHDKFLLHHYVKEDMLEVIEYLGAGGIDFDLEWLESFFAFRFPVLGEAKIRDMHLTIRAGIEPWNVLGEEMSNAGTARFVDSSVEKIEIKITGLQPERFAVLCNRVEIPLQATGTKGTFVSGIRYKAWNPPSALHPTIGVDTPLTFDIYDLWNERSIGGCTYHVAHPGGRNYETFPINMLEAEGRRVTRFFDENHSQRILPGPVYQEESGAIKAWVQPLRHNPEDAVFQLIKTKDRGMKYTLDLRRVTKF